MDSSEFEQMVARLEAKSRQSPGAYQLNVALLAVLGFAILALIIGLAGASALALIALPFALWWGGVHSIGLLAGLGKLLLLLVLPLWLLVKSSMSAVLTRFPKPEGLELTRAQAPALFAAMDDMRQRMHGPRFHHVLISEDLNAAVVQRPLFGLFGPSRNYLILGLPLLESLPADEALAVVAHEYGHLAGSHGHFGAFIYRLRAGWGTVQALSHQWQGVIGSMLQRLVGWYAPYFNAYSFVLARANEYEADAASAELVGAQVTAQALTRTDVSGSHYGEFVQQTFRQVASLPQPPEDFAIRWAAVAQHAPPDEAQRALRRALAAPTGVADTHPPLRQRLQALLGDQSAADTPLPEPVQGPTAAVAWLGDSAGSVREAMQARWRERVSSPWKEQHEQRRQQRQRLDELCAKTLLTQDEHAERLRLRLACDESEGFSDDIAAFMTAYPTNALGPYLDGVQRLGQQDETGLDCLEQAMALDADAIKPACERAFEYLREREDPRAEGYRERWNQRDAWESKVAPQMGTLDTAHELLAPDLKPEDLARIRELLHAYRDGIARAFIARRVLPADASVATYVIGLQLQPAPPRLETWAQVVSRVADSGGWPVHLIVTALEAQSPAFSGRLKTVAVAVELQEP